MKTVTLPSLSGAPVEVDATRIVSATPMTTGCIVALLQPHSVTVELVHFGVTAEYVMNLALQATREPASSGT